MNQAIAAVGPSSLSASTEATTPSLFRGGMPDPGLSVVSASMSAPLDQREATIHLGDSLLRCESSLRDDELIIAVPHALSDGEVRWQVLVSGRITGADRERAVGKDGDTRVVCDRLSMALAERADVLGPWERHGLTLESMLRRLGAMIDGEVVFACDAGLVASAAAVSTLRTESIEAMLRSTLSGVGLSLQQQLTFDDGRARRTLTVLPARSGRRVALPWADDAGRSGSVRSVSVDRATMPPRRWIARGDRPVVEDTFELQPGWDISLQGQPDSDYGRLTSSDFSRFSSVYRAWVLNEDGLYDGPAFDLGALFDAPGTITSPLRFGSCLTQDASGRRLSPVIESSTESGFNWSAYPGRGELLNDRAGVLLMDDVLPGSILSAAKAGTLRLRVTASLTSPDKIAASRWDGNPFAGPAPTRVLDFDDAYAWRYVSATSIHQASIESGLLQADTADDRRALRQRLQDHVAQPPGTDVSAQIELHGAWSALRPGDQVRDALGRGVAIDGTPSGFAMRDARIQRIDLTFGVSDNTPRTRLRLD